MSKNLKYRLITKCPWCSAGSYIHLYNLPYGDGEARKCSTCGFVYASHVLDSSSINDYWKDYESAVHVADDDKVQKRKKMYAIDYGFIKEYLGGCKTALDVGCSNGDFLDFISRDVKECEGIEIGEDAYNIAKKKYNVFRGDICAIDFVHKYDLIVFRGTIQYLLDPKKAFDKAVSILNQGGLLFITASPNSESICHKLYGKNFSLPVTPSDYWMFSKSLLDEYMIGRKMKLIDSEDQYLGTPYENLENDILEVASAIQLRNEGKSIEKKSPAFYGNMLTLLYRKE